MHNNTFKNINELLQKTVQTYPDLTAYKWFVDDTTTDSVTWKQFYSQVMDCAKSLMALGLKKGDKVNILSATCYRWVLADLAITSIGGCTVGIYQSNLSKDCQYIINHSDAVIIFAENQVQLEKLIEIKTEIPNVKKVVLFNGDYDGDDWIISFADFLDLGKEVIGDDVNLRIKETASKDLAGIIYTSGTTGVPKGAVLTNNNIVFTAQSVYQSLDIRSGEDTFLFLPLAHVFARVCIYLAMIGGVTTSFAKSMDTLVDDLKVCKPHWFASVPRIYEKIYSKVISGAEAKGGIALEIFKWACNVGSQVSENQLDKKGIPILLGLKYGVAAKVVFSKIHDALGGRVRFCISGAAPLNPIIGKFFHAAGIPILEGLGMSENTSFTNVNRIDNLRIGWVGQPGPGISQKIADDGEILFKGPNVMKEYYKMPDETAQTIDKDNWLHTGDIGIIDDHDFLKITGRKKELIITAGGKNIAPAHIEGVIATSKFINQVCLVGDQRKYLTALVTLDGENTLEYAKEKKISHTSMEDLIKNQKIISMIEKEVMHKCKQFASFESIKKIAIVPEFTVENGMATPTLKLKKNLIMNKYKAEIDHMYPSK